MHRDRPSVTARRVGLVAVLATLAFALGACGHHHGHRRHGALAYQDDRAAIPVVTTQIGGKNIFIPSTIVVTAGTGRSLTFFNTTETPHGLHIPGLGIQEVLPSREEFPVALPELRPGHVYEIRCHLHPPHRGAALVVLPRR